MRIHSTLSTKRYHVHRHNQQVVSEYNVSYCFFNLTLYSLRSFSQNGRFILVNHFIVGLINQERFPLLFLFDDDFEMFQLSGSLSIVPLIHTLLETNPTFFFLILLPSLLFNDVMISKL